MGKKKLVIHGAAGRMGQRLIALASADSRWELVGALESENHPRCGEDAGEIAGVGSLRLPITASLPEADVVVDFSVPDATIALAEECSERKIRLVTATTGLDESQLQTVRTASEQVAVLWAPSMSLLVNLTMKLAETAGAALAGHESGVDVEIIERHHRFKEDAPSGTALKFGELIAAAVDSKKQVHGREGQVGPRSADEIGYHAVRVGDNPGEHTIVFGLLGETLELHVSATNRDAYASGALAAANFLAGRDPGWYGMNDVLGF
ncbi:MAG: 4-hydroxy-tetrahydrodipicolinate reductase [Planctomycetota bacterium]|nr:4-hydroxy-tetrahydrodipicolinate reductase [Planctomycetota bacterium]